MERSPARRLVRALLRTLALYGTLRTGPCPPPPPGAEPGADAGCTDAQVTGALPADGILAGPGPGHPERVRPEVALTPLERALLRELR